MKILPVVLLAIAFALSAFAAPPQQASLTLKADKVIFQNSKDRLEYKFNKVPGLSAVNFEMKTTIRDGEEINASELTLENQSNGIKFTLVESTPLTVLWDTKSHSWKPANTK